MFSLTRYDFVLTEAQWLMVFVYASLAVSGQIIAGLLTQHYLGRSRIGSFTEASWTAIIVIAISFPLLILFTFIDTEIPRGVTLAAPPIALLFMGVARWLFRSLIDARPRSDYEGSVPALIYGAGNTGFQVIQLMDISDEPPYRIVGLIDDDPEKKRLRVRGVKVRGTGEDLVKVARDTGAEVVILAVTAATAQMIQHLENTCRANGLELLIVPPVREMVGGQVTLGSIRQLNVADLLGRRPIKTDLNSIASYVTGKVVLVTGAGGSIGSELALQAHKLGPSRLLLVDRDESALHSVQLSLYGNGLLDTDETILCDIRDEDALQSIFERHQPDVVFHAAAGLRGEVAHVPGDGGVVGEQRSPAGGGHDLVAVK